MTAWQLSQQKLCEEKIRPSKVKYLIFYHK